MKFLLIIIALMSSIQAQASHIRIMPLGDSITEGKNVPGGYRVKLEKRLTETKINFEFVGSNSDGPPALKSKSHEGHSGWRIGQLSDHISTLILSAKPDVVLLMIGTNDIWTDAANEDPDVPARINRLKSLLKSIHRFADSAKILVASIPPTTNFWNHFVIDYNREIKSLVETKEFSKYSKFVDVYAQLSSNDLDAREGIRKVHPSKEGYDKIADTFFAAIVSLR